LTVAAPRERDVRRLSAWAESRGLKFTHILLDGGLTPSQPMLTRHARGTLDGEIAAARDLAAGLAGVGLAVCRIKIEVAADHDDAPRRDDQADGQPSDRHFEHHVKLLLPVEASLERIARLAWPHGGHVSRNARKRREDGRQERFVTQRCYGGGSETAGQRFERLVEALSADGIEILDTEREYVVYDDNAVIDAGWIASAR
jgi:hypothetical protein